MTLERKTAIVTGGAVRVGRALALALAEDGYNLVLHYGGSVTAAQATKAEIEALGQQVMLVQADFNAPVVAAQTVMAAAVAAFGGAQVLINNAAIFERAGLADTDENLYDRHLNINLKAPFFLAQAFAQALDSDQEGFILNVNDWKIQRPSGAYHAYELSKAGLDLLTRSLARELAPKVRVNQVALGAILPPPGEGEAYFAQKAKRIALKRTGSPADVVRALRYLLNSEFITGATLPVTGGEELLG